MKLGIRSWGGIAAAVALIGLGALAMAQPPRGPGGGPGALVGSWAWALEAIQALKRVEW